MGRRHLLALDGRDQGEKALDWYLENFYRSGDEVVIFHSSSFKLHIGMPGAMVNVDSVQQQVADAKTRIEQVTHLATEKLKQHNVQGYVRTKTGHSPADLINECVEEEKVDHVFMGTRDLNTVQRAFMGSVSTAVARTCKVPVTIVKIQE